MLLVPLKRLTLRTHLPPEVFASRIAQDVEWTGPPGFSGRAFRGQVHALGFDLVPVLRGRVNTWRPRVLGSIRPAAYGGTAVEVVMRLDVLATLFSVAFLGFALLMVTLLVVVSAYNDWQVGLLFVALWPAGIGALGYVRMVRAFSMEASNVERRLTALCAEPPSGPAYR